MNRRLRESGLVLGDLIALDAIVAPAINALGAHEADGLRRRSLALRAPNAASLFIREFEAAVRATAGTAFDDELERIGKAVRDASHEHSLVLGARAPVDGVDVVIERWLSQIAANDLATAAHSRAVGAWSSRIAERMSLDADEVTHVARCGIVHDIGKLRTPQDVLLAARRLNNEEWAVMQRHVIDGWQIAVETPELRPFAPAVRGHHERFDGRGYPDELPGSQLSLATRIVSVADSFNAMIADRPYRPPMSPMHAIEELERHRATQFDPDCVDAMIDVVLARI